MLGGMNDDDMLLLLSALVIHWVSAEFLQQEHPETCKSSHGPRPKEFWIVAYGNVLDCTKHALPNSKSLGVKNETINHMLESSTYF